jgi:transcriptional regulator with XRE-family HTH domain
MLRKQLGRQLRALREAAGLRMEDAAAELDCARSRISQLETGRYGVRKPDLVALLRLYGALDQLNELEELRREGAKRGWWSTSKLPKWLQAYLGMEEDATSTQIFSLELIPGLLQTEDYAHAVHFGLPSDEVNRRVAARMQRQVRLTTQKNPLELSVVLSEAAVTRTLAMGELGIGQLRHLTEISTLPTIAIRVLPFSAGVHPSMAGSFTLLNFAPGVSPPVAYQEYAVGGHIVDDQEDVQKLSALYDQLQAQALDENRSLDMISELTRRTGG